MPINFRGDTADRSRLCWNTDVDWNLGTIPSELEVIGTGDAGSAALKSKDNETNNIDFTTPGDYTLSNGSLLEIATGLARLKSLAGDNADYPFTTPANYTYDSSDIEVTGGNAQLVATTVVPYAWWHLNESSGFTASDSSGNGRDGTLTNMEESDWVAGKLNNCLDFGGVNEYIEMGNIAAFDRTDAFSFDLWFNTSSGTGLTFFSKRDASTQRGWDFFKMNTNKLRFDLINTINTNHIRVETPAITPDGTWQHVAVSYDGSGSASGVHIYLDGVDQTLTILLDNLTATTVGTNSLRVGDLNTGGQPFIGKMDEIAIYDFELMQSDVTFRYNSGTGTESMPDHYVTTDPTIENNTGLSFTVALDTFTETAVTPSGSAIKYQISSDNGTTYKWWNGASWVARTEVSVVTAVNTTVGTVDAGNLASLQTLDGSTYDVSEIGSNPGFTIEMDMSNVNSDGPDNVVIHGYYTGNHTNVDVDIWDFNTSSWVTLGQMATSGASIVEQSFAVTGSKSDKVEDGVVQIRINHDEMGNASHDIFLDYVYVDAPPTNEWWFDNESNTASEVHTNIGSLAASGTFKFLAFLDSDSTVTPELDRIQVSGPNTYSTTDNLYVETTNSSQINPTLVLAWLSVTFTSTTPVNTELRILFSVDGRVNWLTWSGSTWVTPASATTRTDATSLSDAVTNFSSLPSNKPLDVRVFIYSTDSSVTPSIDNIEVTSDAGFETSGIYETNQPNSGEINNPWDIVSFVTILGSGGAVVVKAKAANSTSELDADSYGPSLSNGDDAGVTGQYIQFEITITGDGTETSSIDRLCVDYENPARDIVSP